MVTRNKVLTRALAAAVLAVSLSACSGGNDDLHAYIDQVKAPVQLICGENDH